MQMVPSDTATAMLVIPTGETVAPTAPALQLGRICPRRALTHTAPTGSQVRVHTQHTSSAIPIHTGIHPTLPPNQHRAPRTPSKTLPIIQIIPSLAPDTPPPRHTLLTEPPTVHTGPSQHIRIGAQRAIIRT